MMKCAYTSVVLTGVVGGGSQTAHRSHLSSHVTVGLEDTHHNYTFGAELHFKQNYTLGFEQNYTFGAELHSCVEITCIFTVVVISRS